MAYGTLQVGMLVMVAAGVSNTGLLVFSRVLAGMEWPCYRVLSLSCLLTSTGVAAFIGIRKVDFPSAAIVGWLLLRPLFGCGSFMLCILAVHTDTSFGDVASLGSINIVAAAFFGRLFLKEKIGAVQALALVCSMAGAISITQPRFLFGGAGKHTWVGYILALGSGLLDALSFICSRKSANIPTPFIILGTQSVSTVVLFVLGCMPSIIEDYSLDILADSLWLTVTVLGVACALAIACTICCVVGSVLCPAAVSTTVYTSANMTSGYLAQLLLYKASPAPFQICGSALMLAAVLLMVCQRKQPNASDAPADTSPVVADDAPSTNDAPNDNDDNESIASFIASEFAVVSPHSSRVRKRGRTPDDHRPPITSAVSPTSIGI